MENKKKSPSWVAIVLWFIFFWPVGVYLIYKKLSTDKSAAMKNSKVLMGIGYFFIFGAVVMLIETVSGGADASSGVFGILFYLIGGVLIIWGAKKVKKSGEQYKKFIDIVVNQQQYTIDNIAAQMGLSYDETVKGLQKMIDKGYFSGAYIDVANHELVMPKKNQSVVYVQQNPYVDQANAPQQKAVKCPNCGGNNVINVGQVCECDFCGSPLQ